jgi:putative ABC transport system ATP-binding protein
MAEACLIELQEVGRTYGEGRATRVEALRSVTLKIPAGDFVAIVGPSGSGKSTLLHILGCLDRPSVGTYLLDGQDTSLLSDRELSRLRNRRIGFVFQMFNLLATESAVGNVMLPLVYRGVSHSHAREQAMETLAAMGLGNRLRHRPGELSGGEQQRVAIARALVKKPDIILADEPTGNLDSTSGENILAAIEAANARGITTILITHNPAVAARPRTLFRLQDGMLDGNRAEEPPPGDPSFFPEL